MTKAPIRIAVQIANHGQDWQETVDYVREAESLGVDVCWVAEAWGGDAVSALGYLAAVTDTIQLGSSILQLSSRTASMAARTALALSHISDGRFLLGLGASGPQVVEGLDGQPFAHPLGRMREAVEVIRLAAGGERVAYSGTHINLPLPGGEGKALRLAIPANPDLKIYLATLGPKMLELTGEVADGWLGTSFIADNAGYYMNHLRTGAERAGRSLNALDLSQGGDVAFADTDEQLAALIASRKAGLAFSLGGMGSADTNFYNQAYAAQGWDDVAGNVQQLWVRGQREQAAALVPDEMVLATTLVGTEPMVRERLRAWQDAGINTLRVYPEGDTLDQRLATLGRTIELLDTTRTAGLSR